MTPYINYRILLLLFFAAFIINMTNNILFNNDRLLRHRDTVRPMPSSNIVPSIDPREKPPEIADDSIRQQTMLDGYIGDVTAITTASPGPEDNYPSETNTNTFSRGDLDPCPELPAELGAMPSLDEVVAKAARDNIFANIKRGGLFEPRECKAVHRVAVIVPFRDIKKHLSPFLYYLHYFLMKQQLEYQIFIIENFNKSAPFNRAQLFNIGFLEAQRQRAEGWPCVVLHEAHLLPLDSRNLYRCGWYPRQLITSVNKAYRTPYDHNFGGAVAVKRELYQKINGLPNTLIEDSFSGYEDLLSRIEAMNYTVESAAENIGRYRSVKNISRNKTDVVGIRTTQPYASAAPLVNFSNGLSSLSYEMAKTEHHKLFCLISVNVDEEIKTTCVPGYRNLGEPGAENE